MKCHSDLLHQMVLDSTKLDRINYLLMLSNNTGTKKCLIVQRDFFAQRLGVKYDCNLNIL